MTHLSPAFEKLILTELRLVAFNPDEEGAPLTDEKIAQAVTVNEELIRLGFVLTPGDLMMLAKSPSLTGFAAHFRELLPDVSAPPMYPDFPIQVMEMDEAEFRLHQQIHYFSTYDIEWLFGTQVSRGWLPDVQSTEKTESDDTLLKAKVLELVPENKAAITALSRVMMRRERLTLPGKELTVTALSYLEPEDLQGLKVPFKENLTELFDAILRGADGEKRILLWKEICKHTGDVIKCVSAVLPRYRYHFKTSAKRAIVKLLESYEPVDFKANLILSRGKREKSLLVLQFLDYNQYSRSAEHKEAVRALRNGELRSWEAQAKYLLASGDEGALDFIAKRPGMMLRMVNWLLRLGYPDAEIREKLIGRADAISPHTIVDILNALDRKEENAPQAGIYRAKREESEKRLENALSILRNPESFFMKYVMSEEYKKRFLRSNKNNIRRLREEISRIDRAYEAACDLYARTAPYADRVRAILTDVLREHLGSRQTELAGKKVYFQMEEYDLAQSRLEGTRKSAEGGYLPGGMAIRIPEQVRRIRFFVYWNDKERVDLDLHAMAYDVEGEAIHVGWNASFNKSGIVHSGDITHSNAAEYIDIDLSAPLRNVDAKIHLYYGKPSFGKIQTCYVGMMAVRKFKEKVKLYDPKNCFFTHELRSEGKMLSYGYIDVPARLLFFTGREPDPASEFAPPKGMYRSKEPCLSVKKYLEMLLEAQNAKTADTAEDAELILTIGKSADIRGISLADRNFYLEA